MNSRILANAVLFSLAAGLSVSAQAQGMAGGAGMTPGAPGPVVSTPGAPPATPGAVTPPLAPPAPSTLQGPTFQGQSLVSPNGVTQGIVGAPAPGLCPCSVTTPVNRPPVGGCNC
jgi:hypothetical protein